MRVNEQQGVHIQGEIWEFLLFYMLARIKDTTLVEILIQEEIQVLLRSLEVVLIREEMHVPLLLLLYILVDVTNDQHFTSQKGLQSAV